MHSAICPLIEFTELIDTRIAILNQSLTVVLRIAKLRNSLFAHNAVSFVRFFKS